MRDWRSDIRERLAAAKLDPASEGEVVEELAQHLEDQVHELRGRGMTDDQIEAALLEHLAAPEFPGAVLARKRRRPSAATAPIGAPSDMKSLIGSLWQDIRYGWRSLRRSPAFMVVAVLSLGLGIGATTAIFGLLHTVLLERLAVSHPEQLIAVQFTPGTRRMIDLSYTEYSSLKLAPGLPALAASTGAAVTVVVRNAREFSSANMVTGGYFEMLGVRPLIGRTISSDDDAARAPIVVIGEDFWRDHFDADPAALGQTMSLNGSPFTIVGVLPRDYRGLLFGGSFLMAIPLGARTLIVPPDPRGQGDLYLSVVGRLTPGMTRESAGDALDRAYRACCLGGAGNAGMAGPDANVTKQPVLFAAEAARGLTGQKSDLRGEYRRILQVLMAGVAIVLLIACANVGNLLLVRAAARRREVAVRMSMGATRSRLIRQFLIESLELAVSGGVLGLVLARLGTSALSHNLPPLAAGLSDRVALRASPMILGFTAAIIVGCTIVFGMVPAFRATRDDIVTPLKDGARSMTGHRWWSLDRGLVVAQVALALVLVCAATLFVATLRNLRQFDGGYRSSQVLLAYVDTRGTPHESRRMNPIYPDILARVARIPGVERVAAGGTLPVFGGRVSRSRISVPGYEPSPGENMGAWNNTVTPGFFAATGIGLRAGRDFDARDTEASEPVVIVSDAFVKRFFFGRDPIGGSIALPSGPGQHPIQMRIVGVANDARYDDLRAPPGDWYYIPLAQLGNEPYLNFAVRTSADPADVAAALLREIDAVAPGIRIRRFAGVEQVLNEALSRERLSAAVAALFGLFALTLAVVGLYGVVAYNVARRTSEIGLRMALGATPRDALWLVVRQTLVMTGVGLGIGVPLAVLSARAIGAQLYGIGATDPRSMIGAAALLAVVGAAASIIPGRRAARIDPVEALRAD